MGKPQDSTKNQRKQLITDIMNEDAKDGLYKQQTTVEWLVQNIPDLGSYIPFGISMELHAKFQQAKEMEEQQKNNMPIHIHEGILNTWVYIEDGVVHVKANDKTYGGNK